MMQAAQLALVLALSFLIGLEREEHKQKDSSYTFGGVRTFPLVGLLSYSLALFSGSQLVPWSLGFAVFGGLMLLSYHHKLSTLAMAGVTTEVSGLATYVVGGLVARDQFWIASAIAVFALLLLELKRSMEGLATRFPPEEVVTFTKFLLLTVVILPVVPNEEFTPFHINPFKTWLVVVAVSGISYASYVLRQVVKDKGGVMLSALLGGAYSSTATTLALARRAKQEPQPHLFAGSILAACGVMYARLVLLLLFFNRGLAGLLWPWFTSFAAAAVATGWLYSRRPDKRTAPKGRAHEAKNPLELKAALLFAAIFVGMLVVTSLARTHLGHSGLYALAAVLGVSDVDPFILGLAQSGAWPAHHADAAAIAIAASSNNVAKAAYAFAFADRETGKRCLVLLLGLAAIGLLPLIFLAN